MVHLLNNLNHCHRKYFSIECASLKSKHFEYKTVVLLKVTNHNRVLFVKNIKAEMSKIAI